MTRQHRSRGMSLKQELINHSDTTTSGILHSHEHQSNMNWSLTEPSEIFMQHVLNTMEGKITNHIINQVS